MRLILNIILMASFGLLFHNVTPLHYTTSISEYKYKWLVKTTFKLCGKPIFLKIYHVQLKYQGF